MSGAQEFLIQGDVSSAQLRKLLQMLNESSIPVTRRFSAIASGVNYNYVVLGSWRQAAWIRNVRYGNDNAALANAATEFGLTAINPAGALNLTPAAAVIGSVQQRILGFTANFPANTALWAEELVAGTNCDAKTGNNRGVIVPAGYILAAFFKNVEGAARNLEVQADVVLTDRINVQPGDLSKNSPFPNQRFHVRARGME